MPTSQRIVQTCLFIVAAIALVGGTVQMVLGQPDTSPRLDNVHRFMAGVYFSMGLIAFWAARTVRRQGTLVYLIALGVFLAGCGRLLSISQVGLPTPYGVRLMMIGRGSVLSFGVKILVCSCTPSRVGIITSRIVKRSASDACGAV